jgi:hypothetical protein
MFNSSISQDIFTLLVKSIDIIISKKLSPNEFNSLFKLSNFLRPFRTSKEIKSYVTKTKRYDELITLNKHELNRDPIDLVNYIIEKGILREKPFEKVDTYNQFMNYGNPRQVFDYILSSTTEERLQSYVDVIKRFKNCTLPQSENIFVEYYTAQTFQNSFQSLLDNMITFSNVSQINIDSEIELFNTVFSFIQRVYKTKIDSFKNERIEFDLDTEKSKTLIKAPYTENMFQNKNKIMKLITDYNIDTYEDFDLSDYRDIVEMVFSHKGKYELNETHKQFYFDNFRELLKIDSFNMMNNNANIKTLIAISNLTYKLNLNHSTENY